MHIPTKVKMSSTMPPIKQNWRCGLGRAQAWQTNGLGHVADDSNQESWKMVEYLTGQIDACQHDVLRVMVKTAESEVKALEKQQSRSCHFVWKGERLADLLHFALVVFA